MSPWFVISPDQTRHWTTYKRGLYVKSYCFFERKNLQTCSSSIIWSRYQIWYDLEILQNCGNRIKTKSQEAFGLDFLFWKKFRGKLVGALLPPFPCFPQGITSLFLLSMGQRIRFKRVQRSKEHNIMATWMKTFVVCLLIFISLLGVFAG